MKRSIIKTLAVILAAASALSATPVLADEPTAFSVGKVVAPSEDKLVKIGGLNYIITKDPTNVPGKCTVSVNTLSTAPSIVIPAQISIQGKIYNVTEIADNAFAENKYVKTIEIGSNVETIAPTAFAGALSLSQITVEMKSNYFTSIDGILYTKDKSVLVACPMAKDISSYTAPNSLLKIAACAFYGNHSIYSVVLNNSKISEIGDFAFTNCSNLSVCNLGYSIEKIGTAAFAQTDLKTLVLPVYLKEIGSGAFAGTKIETVRVPDEVTVIPYGTFSNCINLKEVKWGNKVETIGDYAFANTALKRIDITEFVKTIGYSAFAECKQLKTIVLGKRLNTISDYAFADCEALESISIPSAVLKIGDGAFFGCRKLLNIHVDASNPNYATDEGVLYSKGKIELLLYPAARMNTTFTIPTETVNIRPDALTDARYINEFYVEGDNKTFKAEDGVLYSIDGYELVRFPMGKNYTGYSVPDNVYKIRSRAFYGSVIAGILNIGGNVKEIGENAFTDCENVTGFNVPENNPAYKSVDGVLYTKDMQYLINFPVKKTLAKFDVPEGVNVIEDSAFMNCSVSDVTLPQGLLEIRAGAFVDSKLSSINLPSSLTLIDDYAFANTFLSDVAIPGSIVEMGHGAFAENLFLSTVSFVGAPSVSTVGANVFYGDNSLIKIYVPSGNFNEYKVLLINMDVDNYAELLSAQSEEKNGD